VGEYVLIQTIAQLMIPLVTLNVTVALTREASADVFRTVELLKRISVAVVLAFALATLAFYVTDSMRWVCAAVMLGLSEALYNALTAFFMGRESSAKVLRISLIRVSAFFVLLIATYFKWITIIQLVSVFSGLLVLLSAAVIWSIVSRVHNNERLRGRSHIAIGTMYRYSVATLPHTAALWFSISSDRAILGALIGKAAVGQYAIAFTLAQSVMVLIAGVISAIPPRIIKDIEFWKKPANIISFVQKIAGLSLIINFFALSIFYINNQYITLVPQSSLYDLITLSLIGSGYFMSLFYVFYASYLYQKRNTGALSWIGFGLLPLNFGIIYTLVFFFGKVGAASGLLLSYTCFGAAYGWVAVRLVPELRAVVMPLAFISVWQILGSLVFALILLSTAY
jgi:O-antigen/teichoic acid export membrane protein